LLPHDILINSKHNTASAMKPASGNSCHQIPEEMNRCRRCIPC